MKLSVAIFATHVAAILAVAGCTGGGPDTPASPATPPPSTPPATSPAIKVSPTTYDFGKVTVGNAPAPLEVTVTNNGSAALNVIEIALRDPANPNFKLSLSGGTTPCASAATISPGGSCTFQVVFQSASTGAFTESILIRSNDPTSLVLAVPVVAATEPVATLTVRINQLQFACPSNEVLAYVSVTDQGGYPVTGMSASNFTVMQDTTARTILSLNFVDVYYPIAMGAAMDYSTSVTDQPVVFSDMKNAFSGLFSTMRAGDLGEVLKFGSEVETTQAFTPDKARLLAAVSAPFDKGNGTKLYDAAFQAVDDAATNTSFRRAVVIATDGIENGSARSLADVTANATAKKVPVFTVGIGNQISKDILQEMATTTGGLYYEAGTSQNLATIYQQLSSILYKNQYVLRFDQLTKGTAGSPSTVRVGAALSSVNGAGTAPISSCN